MGSARSNDAWTARTVQGPRRHSTRRISSSALVGRGGAGRGRGRLGTVCTRLVVTIYEAVRTQPVYPGGASHGSARLARVARAASGNACVRAWRAGDSVGWSVPVRSRLPEVLLAVHLDQLEEVRQGERSDQQPEDAEVGHARERADQGDERMDVGPAAEHARSEERRVGKECRSRGWRGAGKKKR